MSRWRMQMPAGMFPSLTDLLRALRIRPGITLYSNSVAKQRCSMQTYPCRSKHSRDTQHRFSRTSFPWLKMFWSPSWIDNPTGLSCSFATGEEVRATKVVVATGLSHAAYTPATLATLPAELLSHNSEHDDLGKFKGREIIVIGGGQSALETAALLNERQARVSLLIRRPSIDWNDGPHQRHDHYGNGCADQRRPGKWT